MKKGGTKNNKEDFLIKVYRRLGLKKNEVYGFLENLSILLSAGMSLSMALKAMKEEDEGVSRRLKIVLSDIEKEIDAGGDLSSALKKANIITSHMLSLIRSGEQSGRLEENLKVIVLQNEKEMIFRSKVRSSLMYAAIVFSMTIVIGVGTAWFTLPKLAMFFNDLNADLPLITQFLIFLGSFLGGTYGVFIISLFFVLVIIVFYFLFSFPRTKFIGHHVLFKIPVIKNLIRQVEISRFGFILGTMLGAGISAKESFNALPSTTTFNNYKSFYIYLGEKIEEGKSIRESFSEYPKIKKLFPASVRQMISASEQSGSLSDILLRIGKMFEQKTETTAKNLPVILEPIILIFIGLGVAILALGVIMPIYNLSYLL